MARARWTLQALGPRAPSVCLAPCPGADSQGPQDPLSPTEPRPALTPSSPGAQHWHHTWPDSEGALLALNPLPETRGSLQHRQFGGLPWVWPRGRQQGAWPLTVGPLPCRCSAGHLRSGSQQRGPGWLRCRRWLQERQRRQGRRAPPRGCRGPCGAPCLREALHPPLCISGPLPSWASS